jgi:hypothetical protein
MIVQKQRYRQVPIELALHEKGKQYQRKLEVKERLRTEHEQKLRQQSKLNAVSERIVQEKYLFEGEGTAERLHKPIGTVKPKTLETIDKPTFKPKISETSLEILAQSGHRHKYFATPSKSDENEFWRLQQLQELSIHGGNVYDPITGEAVLVENGMVTLNPNNEYSTSTNSSTTFYKRSKAWEEQRKQKLEYDKRLLEQKEREICSFKPNIKSNMHNQSSNNYNNNNPTSSLSIAERHQQWLQQKEQKLQIERMKQSQDEIKDCTFVPKVPIPPKSLQSIPSKITNKVRHHSNNASFDGDDAVRSSFDDGQMSDYYSSNQSTSTNGGFDTNFSRKSYSTEHNLYQNESQMYFQQNNLYKPTEWLDPDHYGNDMDSLEHIAHMSLQTNVSQSKVNPQPLFRPDQYVNSNTQFNQSQLPYQIRQYPSVHSIATNVRNVQYLNDEDLTAINDAVTIEDLL